MGELNESCLERDVADGDIKILKMMFEKKTSTKESGGNEFISNIFGQAVWSVLYNDEYVTEKELEYLQVYIDNGISSDPKLVLLEEMPEEDKPYNLVNSQYVEKDENYYKLMKMIGRDEADSGVQSDKKAKKKFDKKSNKKSDDKSGEKSNK